MRGLGVGGEGVNPPDETHTHTNSLPVWLSKVPALAPEAARAVAKERESERKKERAEPPVLEGTEHINVRPVNPSPQWEKEQNQRGRKKGAGAAPANSTSEMILKKKKKKEFAAFSSGSAAVWTQHGGMEACDTDEGGAVTVAANSAWGTVVSGLCSLASGCLIIPRGSKSQ